MCHRLVLPWMQDLMAACQEISWADVALSRSGGDGGPATAAENAGDHAAIIDLDPPPSEPSELVLKALTWATKLQDEALVTALAKSLPAAVRNEQLQLYNESLTRVVESKAKEPGNLLVSPQLLKSRMQVAAAYAKYLKDDGHGGGKRAPRNAVTRFVRDKLTWPWPVSDAGLKKNVRNVRMWHKSWQKSSGHSLEKSEHKKIGMLQGKRGRLDYKEKRMKDRQRGKGLQGRPCACAWVRRELFDWFVTMRYAVDWKKYNAECRSRGRYKAMGRFPRSLMRNKVKQLLHDYCLESLVHGVKVEAFQPTARWFGCWETEFGVTRRQPNRKYKVAKWIMAERLEIMWCNTARVRALWPGASGGG